jgi:hypothetical protein
MVEFFSGKLVPVKLFPGCGIVALVAAGVLFLA